MYFRGCVIGFDEFNDSEERDIENGGEGYILINEVGFLWVNVCIVIVWGILNQVENYDLL